MRQQATHVFRQQVAMQSLRSTVCMLSMDRSGSMGCAGRMMSMWKCKCGEMSEHMVVPGGIDFEHYYKGAVSWHMPRTQVLTCPKCNSTHTMMLAAEPEWEQKIALARKCAIVFAHALESVNVPFGIYTWTTGDPDLPQKVFREIKARSEDELEEARKLYTRFGGLSIVNLKDFKERWQPVSWRLATVNAQMCNYDGESLLYGARRLMERDEKRKVMFVLCDGIPGPCLHESHEAHGKYLTEVIAEIRGTTSVEIVGIGIGAPEAEKFYKPQFVNVLNASELPNMVIKQLKRVLLT